jgi:hypothetical protein
MAENTQQFSIKKKDEYLLITFPPYRSVQQAELHIAAMYDAVDEYNCRKLLIDLRATQKKVPIMELYELCLYLVSKFGPLHAKIAALASPEAVYPDRFGENVVRNRGLDLIRFVGNMQEAQEWLLMTTPAIQQPNRTA